MSGGVDSSVSAALLKKEGFKVIGVFIKVWEPLDLARGKPFNFCNWREEQREARRATAHLDIPLLTLDLSREYKKKVVDYFIAEYKAGRTPNPDVMCNKHIKFGIFYDWALAQGADFVATGHYAQILRNGKQKVALVSTSPRRPGEDKDSFLFGVSRDLAKDQTYFLWNLRQDQLAKILFPVGDYTKTQVRALAKKFGLPNAEKKDSQGLCFVGRIDFKDFLKRELKEKKGNVLNEQGKIIGHHDGAMFFTLGERHGFEVFKKTSDEKPYYIIAKDIEKNTLTVSNLLTGRLGNLHPIGAEKLEVKIEKTNWIGELSSLEVKPRSAQGFNLQARIRYRQPLQSCEVAKIDNKEREAIITFASPQLAVPGQSLVLYCAKSDFAHKGLICLGGGIIS